MIKNRMTGEISMPPRFGSRLRIGRSAGSVCGREIHRPADELISRVDHVEGHQPGQDRRRDQDPNVDPGQRSKEQRQGIFHRALWLAAGVQTSE